MKSYVFNKVEQGSIDLATGEKRVTGVEFIPNSDEDKGLIRRLRKSDLQSIVYLPRYTYTQCIITVQREEPENKDEWFEIHNDKVIDETHCWCCRKLLDEPTYNEELMLDDKKLWNIPGFYVECMCEDLIKEGICWFKVEFE